MKIPKINWIPFDRSNPPMNLDADANYRDKCTYLAEKESEEQE